MGYFSYLCITKHYIMKNTRDLLEKEILNDAKNGDTTVLAEILASLSDEYVFASLSDKGQESLNWEELKIGDKIVALRDTRGISNSYNTPERIDISEGTMLHVYSDGTNRGDVFTKFVSGKAIKHLRGGSYEGQQREQVSGDIVGLSGDGHKTRYPYDLGIVDLRVWGVYRE
jgi:hypothetical protein